MFNVHRNESDKRKSLARSLDYQVIFAQLDRIGADNITAICLLLLVGRRIHTDFRYDPRATTIATPVEEVLLKRSGVCQDFAHLMIACVRSLGLPARYISGYLRSNAKTLGGEASHAWCAIGFPDFGWLEFDPTNNVMPNRNHITIAHGRDYSDVAPVMGVALGGGEQLINVNVEVLPPAK